MAVYDFDTLVDKKETGNMKHILTPNPILEANITNFAGAEIDFKTAPCVINAIKKRAHNGLFGFTLADQKYFDAVVWWMKKARNWDISSHCIVPTHGTIFSVATCIRMLTKEGEGVVIQPPVYHRYEQAIKRLNRKAVYNSLIHKDGIYTMDFENLERLLADENNKFLIICNPHNPICKVWNERDLENIALLSKKHKKIVFSDEIFAEVTFNNQTALPYCEIKNASEYGIVSTSIGKSFSCTGINHANMIIPNKYLRDKFILQRNSDHYGSIDPITYAAICGAYTEDGYDWLEAMVIYVENNYHYIKDYIQTHMPNIKISPLEGTFSTWLNMNNLNMTNEDLISFLAEKALLSVDSGVDYGIEGAGFIRMNLGTSFLEVKNAVERLHFALNNG